MSLFRRSAHIGAFVDPYRPPPNSSRLGATGTGSALRVSAVWACLRLRADLISTLPVDVFRTVEDRSVEVPKPSMMINPAAGTLWNEWLYATQLDLDRYGNAFGTIVARDGAGRPAQIELSDASEWSVRRTVGGPVEYRHRGQLVTTADVWHERQFVVAGLPVGLSPIAYAAYSVQHNLSAQQFALTWFDSGASPAGTLKNKAKIIEADDAATMKERFRVATQNRDIFVTGSDWEYTPAASAASDAKFLDSIRATSSDICRFFGVPGDVIDVASDAKSAVTYANVTQRNLQLLTLNLGPAITRRELAFSARLVAAPRFVKFNVDALLRMDAKSKVELIASSITTRIMTPDEGRALLDRAPLTGADYDQFETLFGATKPTPGSKTGATP